jgi:hypothetical protein
MIPRELIKQLSNYLKEGLLYYHRDNVDQAIKDAVVFIDDIGYHFVPHCTVSSTEWKCIKVFSLSAKEVYIIGYKSAMLQTNARETTKVWFLVRVMHNWHDDPGRESDIIMDRIPAGYSTISLGDGLTKNERHNGPEIYFNEYGYKIRQKDKSQW